MPAVHMRLTGDTKVGGLAAPKSGFDGGFELAIEDGVRSDRVRGDKAQKEAKPRVERDVGHALRSAYVATVNEDIPRELLDLLGKLG